MPAVPGLFDRVRVDRLAGRGFDYLRDRAGEKLTPHPRAVGTPPPLRGLPQSTGGYLREQIGAYDPRSVGGAVNLAGLLGGPRVPGAPKGTGFGHAEKEFPSVLPGHTLRRAAQDETYLDANAEPSYAYTFGRDRGHPVPARHRGVNVAYNLHRDSDNKVVGSFAMTVHPHKTRVHDAYLEPEYRSTKAFFDFSKIARGTGRPIEADVANPDLAMLLGRLSQKDPMLHDFDRFHVPPPNRFWRPPSFNRRGSLRSR